MNKARDAIIQHYAFATKLATRTLKRTSKQNVIHKYEKIVRALYRDWNPLTILPKRLRILGLTIELKGIVNNRDNFETEVKYSQQEVP